MGARRCVIGVVLVAVLVLGGVVPALGVSAVPKETPMRLRGVSFVGTSDGWAVGDGILHTTDGGKTWYRQFTLYDAVSGIDMVDRSFGCAVGQNSIILRTTDGGASWAIQSRAPGVTADLYAVDFVDQQYGWAVGDWSSVIRTVDGGRTWMKCTLPASTGIRREILDVSFADRLHGWACGRSLVGGDGFNDLYVIRTSDGGVTWTRCSNGAYQSGGSDDMWEYSGIDFVSATTGWVTGDFGGIHKTTDGAVSWVDQGGLVDLDKIDMFNASVGVGTQGYPATSYYTSNGGATWKKSNLDLDNADPSKSLQLGDICMPSTSQAWTVAQSWEGAPLNGVIAHSSNGGATWTKQVTSTGPVFFLGGETRYETAVRLAQLTDVPADTVVLATGRDYPDALAASGLAGALDATLLLTDGEAFDDVSLAIYALHPKKVVIVGGTRAVPDWVRDSLAMKYDVERIGGANRYETAANIARRMVAEGASPDEVFICCGTDYADAASASSLSYGRKIPILLVKPGELPYPTKRVLGELGSTDAYVVGSSVAVGNPVMRAIESVDSSPTIDAVRVADGVNRYSTSVLLASWASRKGWIDFDRVGIATGANFPDALTGGALMGSRGQTVLLTDPDHLSGATDSFVAGKPVDQVWILNDRGMGAVQDPVGTRLAYLLR